MKPPECRFDFQNKIKANGLFQPRNRQLLTDSVIWYPQQASPCAHTVRLMTADPSMNETKELGWDYTGVLFIGSKEKNMWFPPPSGSLFFWLLDRCMFYKSDCPRRRKWGGLVNVNGSEVSGCCCMAKQRQTRPLWLPLAVKKNNCNGQKNGCRASQVLTMAQIDMDQQKRRGTSDRPVPLCGIVIRRLAAARGR